MDHSSIYRLWVLATVWSIKSMEEPLSADSGTDPETGKSLAELADPHAIYQQAVQNPEADIEFFLRIFNEIQGREPLTLREDFCGTAYLASEWVRGDPRRLATGIDNSGETLEWALRHNIEPAGEDVAGRIELIESSVLDVTGPPVDLICALNFSFCLLRSREELRRYFTMVRSALKEKGMFVGELYGGTEAIIASEEERECVGFNYHWEQERYNPITHEGVCNIHFSFPDGSRLDRAFSYEWRLWSIPEVRDCLLEAGFDDVRIFWETVDEEGVGTGEYKETVEEENQETWLVYIVAPV
jgi:hypothetical protein